MPWHRPASSVRRTGAAQLNAIRQVGVLSPLEFIQRPATHLPKSTLGLRSRSRECRWWVEKRPTADTRERQRPGFNSLDKYRTERRTALPLPETRGFEQVLEFARL